MSVISAFHDSHTNVEEVDNHRYRQRTRQVEEHPYRDDGERLSSLVVHGLSNLDYVAVPDRNRQGCVFREVQVLISQRREHDSRCLGDYYPAERRRTPKPQCGSCFGLTFGNGKYAAAYDLRNKRCRIEHNTEEDGCESD